MVTFEIGGASRTNNDIDEKWINERYRAAAENGRIPCVRVTLDTSDCKFTLSTASCSDRGGSGGRQLNEHEMQIVKLWERAGLNAGEFPPGHVIRFLKWIEPYC
jgi:hypothetical protein